MRELLVVSALFHSCTHQLRLMITSLMLLFQLLVPGEGGGRKEGGRGRKGGREGEREGGMEGRRKEGGNGGMEEGRQEWKEV